MTFRSKCLLKARARRRAGALASAALMLTLASASVALANEADVVDAKAQLASDGTYRFDVTVRHQDEGWDHYADAYEILTPDGEVLAVRTLTHPHENEQPFTRAISGVAIPEGIASVRIRAHDSVHEYGGAEFSLDLPGRE